MPPFKVKKWDSLPEKTKDIWRELAEQIFALPAEGWVVYLVNCPHGESLPCLCSIDECGEYNSNCASTRPATIAEVISGEAVKS